MDITNLLHRIAERPGLYLGSRDLSKMDSFLSGYACCLYDNGMKFENDRCFATFVGNKLQCKDNVSWSMMIIEHCKDKSAAFDMFIDLLQEYRMDK